MDTKETFADSVLSKLPEITDVQDLATVTVNIFQQFIDGWSVEDSVSFNMCLEEVNPIDAEPGQEFYTEEEDRLQLMTELKNKYKK